MTSIPSLKAQAHCCYSLIILHPCSNPASFQIDASFVVVKDGSPGLVLGEYYNNREETKLAEETTLMENIAYWDIETLFV